MYLSMHHLEKSWRRHAFPQQSLRHEEFRKQQLMLYIPGMALDLVLKMLGFTQHSLPFHGENDDKPWGYRLVYFTQIFRWTQMFLGRLSGDFLHSLPSLGLIFDMILPRNGTILLNQNMTEKNQINSWELMRFLKILTLFTVVEFLSA